ncbi:unnamed protein product [Brassicogethes aeneus]|uniref:C2H2-type domain-containing protein n=1 Tax=Brassicogethes aeneus TaxID=1431903 RepID=A0A9P0AT65_BRAAE|nr:unnamed protein product [Brassicogethes aeneus]
MFTCAYCPKTFKRKDHLKSHVWVHQSQEAEQKNPGGPENLQLKQDISEIKQDMNADVEQENPGFNFNLKQESIDVSEHSITMHKENICIKQENIEYYEETQNSKIENNMKLQ